MKIAIGSLAVKVIGGFVLATAGVAALYLTQFNLLTLTEILGGVTACIAIGAGIGVKTVMDANSE